MEDQQTLIKAIEDFLMMPWEEKKRMGLAGREKVEREFDRRIVVDAYIEGIQAIAD